MNDTSMQQKQIASGPTTTTRNSLAEIVARYLIVASLLLGIALRLALFTGKQVLEYDDAISLLAASGHEGEYAQIAAQGREPISVWVPATEWQRLIQAESGHGLDVVARDLAHWDIHPPLYFWLLHLWLRAFGSGLLALQALNLLLDLIIFVTLIWIGWRVFGGWTPALLAGATWFLSPIAMKTTFWVRQYTFLTLVVLVFTYLLYRVFLAPQRTGLRSPAGLGLLITTAAGLLTHYYFSLFVMTGAALVLARVPARRQSRRRAIAFGLVLGAAALVFLAFYPGFMDSVDNYFINKLAPGLTQAQMLYRLKTVLKSGVLLFSPALLALGLTTLELYTARQTLAARHNLRTRLAAMYRQPAFAWSLIFAILPFSMIVLFYLAGVTQAHTLSSRYLGYLSPLVALLAVNVLNAGTSRLRTVNLYWAAIFGLGLAVLLPGLTQSQRGKLDVAQLQSAPLVVIDTIEWGTWPMIVQHLAPDQRVFLAHQQTLADQPELWLKPLAARGGLYIGFERGTANTDWGVEKVLDLIQAQQAVVEQQQISRPEEWTIHIYQALPVERK